MGDWDLGSYLRVIRRWWWLLLVATLVSGGASFLATRAMPKTYRAVATIIIGEDQANPQVKQEDVVTSMRLAASYASTARRQPVLEAAVKTLRLPYDWRVLQENVLTLRVEATQLVEIRVTDSDPQRAAAIANEITRQMILQSPTTANLQDLAERREFAKAQLDVLQANIQGADIMVKERQAAVEEETSARRVLDLRDEIKALQTKIADWRTAYTGLAAAFPTRGPNTLTVLESATAPSQPAGPNLVANVGMAVAVALLLAMAAILVIEYLNSGKVSDMSVASKLLDVLALGAIPNAKPAAAGMVLDNPASVFAEAYRVLRTNIQFAWGSRESMALLVTSPGIGDGKSTVSANLAVSFALAGKRTVLVDADLRHPSFHRSFGILPGEAGLSTLLGERLPDAPRTRGHKAVSSETASTFADRVEALLQSTTTPNLRVLPSGTAGSVNPGELLARPQLEQILCALRAQADVVILDSPPVVPVADTAILSGLAVGVVVVTAADRTPQQSVRQTREILETAHARVIGVVLNRAPRDRTPYYAYGEPVVPPSPGRRFPTPRLLRGISRG